jgi:hypothetical protein
MSDDDLIRRGDISAKVAEYLGVTYGPDDLITWDMDQVIAALPAALGVQPAPNVTALVEAVKRLNAACDAMWNDHNRLEPNPGSFGQKWQLKEVHMKAISEAQQKLPAALAALEASHD